MMRPPLELQAKKRRNRAVENRSADGVIFVAKVSEVDIYYIMVIMDAL